jgi:hypothetical protein
MCSGGSAQGVARLKAYGGLSEGRATVRVTDPGPSAATFAEIHFADPEFFFCPLNATMSAKAIATVNRVG